MECDICERTPTGSLDFVCTTCARNEAYLIRLDYARALLEKSTLSDGIHQTISSQRDDQSSRQTTEHVSWHIQYKHERMQEAKRYIGQLKDSQEGLKSTAHNLKAQIENMKARVAEKKKAIKIVHDTIPDRWTTYVSDLSQAETKASSSLMQIQQRAIGNRAILCREAASLMRLRQRRRQRDTPSREQFSIAGLTLPDLREISNVRCADLTAVLGSVSHLLMLVTFYLGIRLPAEISVPSRGCALAVISTPSASYKGPKGNLSKFIQNMSQPSGPSASEHDMSAFSGVRPLFVSPDNRDERLYKVQKDSQEAFNLFVEGIALLAWNVAWLCRSQGFTTGTNSWEDICNIGKNLHQLLVANAQGPNLTRLQSERTVQKRPVQPRRASSIADGGRKEASGKLGQYSDLAAGHAATRATQNEDTRGWQYLSWQAVASPLRKMLLTEIASAEWEVLQDDEWDDGGEQFNEAVFVKARALDGQQFDDARSIMTARTIRPDDDVTAAGRMPGTSGWTKLKSREQP